MSYHPNAIFPDRVAMGSERISRYNTRVFTHESGATTRVSGWTHPMLAWDVSQGILKQEDVAEIDRFWRARRGATYSFRFKDWWDYHTNPTGTTHNPGDYTATVDQLSNTSGRFIPVEASETGGNYTAFQMVKLYSDAGVDEYRPITKPDGVTSSEITGLSGTLTVDNQTGIVASTTANNAATIAAAKWYGSFYVEAHFSGNIDNQGMALSAADFNANSLPSIEIYEVRPEFETPASFYTGGSKDHGAQASTQTLTTSLANGRFQVFAPATSTTTTVVLSELDRAPAGEGIMVLHNNGAGTLAVQTSYAATPTSVAAGETARVHLIRDYAANTYSTFITVS